MRMRHSERWYLNIGDIPSQYAGLSAPSAALSSLSCEDDFLGISTLDVFCWSWRSVVLPETVLRLLLGGLDV